MFFLDIYLTLLETGDCFRFPMLPERVELNMGNEFANYQILGVGEIQTPSGVALDRLSWSGLFPGECRKENPFIREFMPPMECYKWLENVKAKAGVSKKLRLLITETSVNLDVYLDQFSGEFSGGQGDFNYSISLVQGKDLLVYATCAIGSGSAQVERPALPVTTQYTVVKGDCLWLIAQRFLGSGTRYGEIYSANQSLIDAENKRYGNSKYTIYPGQVFTIPV